MNINTIELKQALENVNSLICINKDGNISNTINNEYEAIATPVQISNLGDSSFCKDFGIKYAYVGGSMAHGIASTELATVLGKAGMLGFIGSAGESPSKIEEAILKMKSVTPAIPFGFNLIHSPNESGMEDAVVDLFLKHKINVIEASAFLTMTLPLIRYRVTGIYRNEKGEVIAPNRIIAKVSRVEVASKFMAPPPENMLNKLVEQGVITQEQAEMAKEIPVARDITSEADSGGHTDNRPAVCLHPTMIALKNRLQKEYNYSQPLRVGFGGGIGTPASAAAAFTMGASYIVLGSIHQSCIESGASPAAKQMLAAAQQADTVMAPAGDMFEMGVTVQVLKRGTMFAMRAQKLYELYRKYNSIDELTPAERQNLEKTILQDTFENIWNGTAQFFKQRDPKQIEKAEADPHHKMALVFRWYLGLSSRWAMSGDPKRRMDYQIWCGPAMGSFNEWAKGSIYEQAENRKAVDLAMNMLYGAAVELRINMLRTQGIDIPQEVSNVRPYTLEFIKNHI